MSATAVPRIKESYYKEILPRLMKEREYPTPMAVPRLLKVVVNMGVNGAVENKGRIDTAAKELKVDTSRVYGAPTKRSRVIIPVPSLSRAVVRSLMDLAARQGAAAIAEGLETAEQLNSLRELGITTGQGYLLGRPGTNIGLDRVDIGALAAGTLILQNAPARQSETDEGNGDALEGSPA